MAALGQAGVLQVIPPAQLEQQLQQQAKDKAAASQPQQNTDYTPLAGYIKGQYEIYRNHRNTVAGWSERLLHALRTFQGQYDPFMRQEIHRFGGSEIYIRLIAQKCRAASSLLRDIYLNEDRVWCIRPPADPAVPPEIIQHIDTLMQTETQMIGQQTGQPPNPSDVDERRRALLEDARDQAKKKAGEQARDTEDKIEGILRDGGFYHALAEFLVDLPIFPFACIKGPVVKVVPTVVWPQGGGQPTVQQKPKLTWERVNPFDLWWTPGVADIENANVIEKLRVTRAELNDLLDLPGYNQDEVRAVLDEYGRGGLYDNWDTTDAERAVLESRENPAFNRSIMISMMEFNGNVQGRILQDYGMAVEDELRDYHIQAWVIGAHVIKAQLTPNPRQRHPYFITSFEKVPGTPVGNGLTDLISDIQEAVNATARSLVNNMAMASGPQVVVCDERLSPDEDGETMFPWKRWHVKNDPLGTNSQVPISFFMPTSNAQALMAVFNEFVQVADDVSAIPKYVGGQGAGSGAGRTASGLAMLMGNASKLLQSVSANIDREVLEGILMNLSDIIMLTDTSGLLTGEEKISVQGVAVAIQRETIRQRQIEFLQATNNPTDMGIMGLDGRANVLRAVSSTIGLPGEHVVPSEQEMQQKVQQQKQQQAGGGALLPHVEQGVQKGVQAGVQRISTELTAGLLAAQAHLPEGMPTHIGTLPTNEGAPPATNNPAISHNAAQAQGAQPSRLTAGGMGPQTHLVGNMSGPAQAHPISPGPG